MVVVPAFAVTVACMKVVEASSGRLAHSILAQVFGSLRRTSYVPAAGQIGVYCFYLLSIRCKHGTWDHEANPEDRDPGNLGRVS